MWEGPDHILDVEMCEQLRREEAEEFIASLPEDERAAAAMDEKRNIHEYERRQELMFSGQHPETVDEPEEKGLTIVQPEEKGLTTVQPGETELTTVPSPSAWPVLTGPQDVHGQFKCNYPGCTAQPFLNQHLLK